MGAGGMDVDRLREILGGRHDRFNGNELTTLARFVVSEEALLDLSESTLHTAFPQPETPIERFCSIRDAILAWKDEKRTGEVFGISTSVLQLVQDAAIVWMSGLGGIFARGGLLRRVRMRSHAV